jgi:hypothetical protein
MRWGLSPQRAQFADPVGSRISAHGPKPMNSGQIDVRDRIHGDTLTMSWTEGHLCQHRSGAGSVSWLWRLRKAACTVTSTSIAPRQAFDWPDAPEREKIGYRTDVILVPSNLPYR